MGSNKTLYLLRHCMAMPAGSGNDKTRDLAPKGKEDALALGKTMHLKKYVPGVAICSPAVRTRQTLEGLMAALPIPHVRYPEALYNGPAGDMLHEIQHTDKSGNALLVVAHNPGIHALALMLTGAGAPPLLGRLAGGFSPGMMAVLKCPCENWQDVQPGEGENELLDILDPQDYNAPARPTRWM